MITALCGLREPVAASARRICGSVSPANPSAPILKKFRRETPSQKRERPPAIRNMANPFLAFPKESRCETEVSSALKYCSGKMLL